MSAQEFVDLLRDVVRALGGAAESSPERRCLRSALRALVDLCVALYDANGSRIGACLATALMNLVGFPELHARAMRAGSLPRLRRMYDRGRATARRFVLLKKVKPNVAQVHRR